MLLISIFFQVVKNFTGPFSTVSCSLVRLRGRHYLQFISRLEMKSVTVFTVFEIFFFLVVVTKPKSSLENVSPEHVSKEFSSVSKDLLQLIFS